MNIWIGVTIIGAIFIILGFMAFIYKSKHGKLKTSQFLIGIFIPIFAALSYAETLKNGFFPKVGFLDWCAFYLTGMISGFFIALYLYQKKIFKVDK